MLETTNYFFESVDIHRLIVMPIIIKNIVNAQTICIQGTNIDVPQGSSLTMKEGKVWLNGKIVPTRHEQIASHLTVVGNVDSVQTDSGHVEIQGDVGKVVSVSGHVNLSGNVTHIGSTFDQDVKKKRKVVIEQKD